MLFFCVVRLFVGLSGVVLSQGANIDEAIIAKAKNGEWIPLPNDSEDMVKFVKSTALRTDSYTYEQLDDFCQKENSHLVSIHSEEEEDFLLDVEVDEKLSSGDLAG
ncbi:hypothetical protein TELCIR_07047 [Teladorsagia circumcincta]|uniref:C-type lectin domain-containing protein n=1 Tax=Teladorsagia circumcincta TaxID=45464 RepID=A0A2G9UMW1_TELCI|nr:hypothetical protein TELCIR_07047 [Teladorsagia circumcincta]